MLRMLSFLILVLLLANCEGNAQETTTTAPAAAPTSDLSLNEKGRVAYSAVLSIADGPFAGTYELGTEKSKGSLMMTAPTAKRLEKFPNLANTFDLSGISLVTADESFGIANVNRRFTGSPAVGHTASVMQQGGSNNGEKCGKMQLHLPEESGIIRHVYVTFLDCEGMEVTGFGREWQGSKYSNKRKRPVAGQFSERVAIEDINSTADTRETHETMMTLTFAGGHSEEL